MNLHMKRPNLLPFFAVVLCCALLASASAAPVKLIYDTDMAEDVDDVGALALLHTLANRGEVEILACMISAPNESVGPCLDAINTFYGRPEIPIGNLRDFHSAYPGGPSRNVGSKYAAEVAKAFPHRLKKSSDAPDAVGLYRKILANHPDKSVVIVSVGFLTNLKNLLNSGKDEHSDLNGEALVAQKVKEWVCMGGIFPGGKFSDGNGEYNVAVDTIAAVRAINDWPTPVIFSGFEIGARVLVGKRLGETQNNPIRTGYQFYNGLQNREAWDLTAVLYAARGAADYWELSEPGFCVMHSRVPQGYNEWIPSEKHHHRYLKEKMAPEKVAKTIEDLILEGLKKAPSVP
jgi:inosine-uridine nucleoside N-ribohydrolase